MMEILRIANYKTLALSLEANTGCDVSIRVMGKEHYHYQIDKMGISLGVLCIDKGIASFAPFVTLDNAQNDQYIPLDYFPMFDDFINLLMILRSSFCVEPKTQIKSPSEKRDYVSPVAIDPKYCTASDSSETYNQNPFSAVESQEDLESLEFNNFQQYT